MYLAERTATSGTVKQNLLVLVTFKSFLLFHASEGDGAEGSGIVSVFYSRKAWSTERDLI